MLAYKIQPHGDFPINSKPRAFTLKNLTLLETQLAESKNALDKDFLDRRFQRAWSALDPFRDERAVVAFIGNIKSNVVTNAWLKCYEMLNYFNIIPAAEALVDAPRRAEFIHFDNASFPGTFILATHHYIATRNPAMLARYRWHGSSLIEQNSQDKEPLEDKFGLMKRYPDNWLMGKSTMNGDVLSEKNQLFFKEKLGGRVDLYTSDLGFDVSEDYNRQEIFHARANAGQILSGLLTLRAGGTMITKQYMFFCGISISMIYALSHLFEELYIAKPATSRAANSEVYLVGKGFRGESPACDRTVALLFDVISERLGTNLSLFDPADMHKKFLSALIRAACGIFEYQIKVVDANVQEARRKKDWSNFNDKGKKDVDGDKEKLVKEWYAANYIMPIDDKDKLF